MKLKCSRCNSFYDSDNPEDMGPVCLYHKGRFQDFNMPFAGDKYGKWPCCKEVFFMSPGCLKGHHIEDVYTSTLLSSFDQTNDGKNTNQITAPTAGEPQKPLQKPPLNVTDEFILYDVQFGDTLAGIAIRFHTNAGKLKQLNRLVTNDEVHTRKTILIPRHPTQTPLPPKQTATPKSSSPIDLVVRKTGVSREEAKFYLEENGGVVAHAVAAIKQDEEWDEEQKTPGGEEDEDEFEQKSIGCFKWGNSDDKLKLLEKKTL
eukprot:Phypoly_transcript_14688.p1 GENE.Phypoly_transcript_14688~~Phypoly_transcript_14688.p1  ORF type:complete len:260 (+),score=41.96 Phypoly_transcript_14688:120-899(+)